MVVGEVQHVWTELREIIFGGYALIYRDELPIFTWNILPPTTVEPAAFPERSIGEDACQSALRQIDRLFVWILVDAI